MAQKLDKHILKNGMALLGEPMENVQSAAFGFMLPAGAAALPAGLCGAANVISDWIFRGAGKRDSRSLCDALDGLGLHRITAVSSSHIIVGAALEAGNLAEALDLYADIILKPRLDDEQFAPARELAVESVLALEDNPQQKIMLKLQENFYGEPLGRSTAGNIEQLKALTSEKTRQLVNSNFNMSQTIFSVAGKYDFDSVCRRIEARFGTAKAKAAELLEPQQPPRKYTHIPHDGAQVHIGLMTPTVTPADENYYNARLAVSVLSGGMSARLFTEVREKRALCYAIGARYHGLKQAAGIGCYAGTIPQKAQETADVIIAEFKRLTEGISKEELQRAKVGLKSALILQSESSSSRAGAIAGDYYMLGRVRSLDEIKEKIEATTAESVLAYLRKNKFTDFTVVTIGPKRIDY